MLSGLVLSGIGDAFVCISRNKCDVVPSATILTSKLGRLLGREYPWGGGGGHGGGGDVSPRSCSSRCCSLVRNSCSNISIDDRDRNPDVVRRVYVEHAKQ
jgi:hypothetical protein